MHGIWGRLRALVAAGVLAAGMLGAFAGSAAALTYPTHTWTSAKLWQCAEDVWQGTAQCRWVQYTFSYRMYLTDYNGTTVKYWVQPLWSKIYIWGGANLAQGNVLVGVLGAAHTTVQIYTTPDGKYRGVWNLSNGLCGIAPFLYPSGVDLLISQCTSSGIGITMVPATYPLEGCFYAYFDSTLVYDNGFTSGRQCPYLYP